MDGARDHQLSRITTFRLNKANYRHDTVSGAGAHEFGGRWNSPGRHVVYCSGNLSIAILE